MKHRLDTQEGVNELKMLRDGEHIHWHRESPILKRYITVYFDLLTPEQKERLEKIEKELLVMAYEADEETRTKTVLKSQRPVDIDERLSITIPRISADLTKRLEKNVADIDNIVKSLPPEANDQVPDEGEK